MKWNEPAPEREIRPRLTGCDRKERRMQITTAHRQVAEKFCHKYAWKDVKVPDTLLEITAYLYNEEEAAVVSKLSFSPLPAMVIARRVKRPIREVEPILKSLSARLLIVGLNVKGIATYGFLNFLPGVFEAQMVLAKTDPENQDFYKRFAELYHQFYDEFVRWIKPEVEKKDLRFGRIVPVEKSIESQSGIIPSNSDKFSEIIERNNSFCIVNACACRYEMHLLGRGCDKPLDVCSLMGWLADFVIEKGLGRRVSREEYIETKNRAIEAGLVLFTDNTVDPLQVCSCCSCCCSGLRALKEYNVPTIITGSHFEPVVDSETCNGCQKCLRVCPMEAITVIEKKVAIDYTRCIGCALCASRCDKVNAISFKERESYKPPAENVFDYYVDRYIEVKGAPDRLWPRFNLGLSQLMGKISPIKISGPGYKPPK